MPGDAQRSADPNHPDRFTRKARVLLELFGPNGLERLQSAGLEPGMMAALEQAADADQSEGLTQPAGRDGLLQRFREKGLLDQMPGAVSKAPEPKPQPVPEADLDSALGQRIAAHLKDDALEKENPAVIAYILKSQPKTVQARVLRALPGSCARATMRHMKR